jgi:hypothetical protein
MNDNNTLLAKLIIFLSLLLDGLTWPSIAPRPTGLASTVTSVSHFGLKKLSVF